MSVVLNIILAGRPITKKNHSRMIVVGGRRMLIPSKQYKAYEDACGWQIRTQWSGQAIGRPVSIAASYYLTNRKGWPDLVGLEQATADILQHFGVLQDDGYIADWDGSRICGIDALQPRVEIRMRIHDWGEDGLDSIHPALARRKAESGKLEV